MIFFALLEVGVRAAYLVRRAFVEVVPVPYRLGDDYGASPPWIDSDRVLEPDQRLLWRNRSGARVSYAGLFLPAATEEERAALSRRFAPWLPEPLRHAKRWSVAVDSQGFREVEFSQRKTPGTFRILCLGDSWTFGANVDQDETYPRSLARRLAGQLPGARFEVLNLGVLGYSSFQGKELLRSRALALEPDLVVLGFGMNDGQVAGYRDKDLAAVLAGPAARLTRVLESWEVYKLLRYWAVLVRERQPAGLDAFRAAAARTTPRSPAELAPYEPWTRVSLADYETNLRDMIRRVKAHGAIAVLLDAEIERNAYGETLERLGREEDVPLVRADRLISRARSAEQRALENRLGLQPASSSQLGGRPDGATGDRIPVVLRAYAGDVAVPQALYVVGEDEALGALVPNRVALHDDGAAGDERAGDGVWSARVLLPRGAVLRYALTNSGSEGRWEGLDVPAVRAVSVPRAARGTVFAPVERFGSMPLQSDAWHTDATGLGLIAESIAEVVESEPAFVHYVRAQLREPGRRSVGLDRPRLPSG